jgi:hypothetical protein
MPEDVFAQKVCHSSCNIVTYPNYCGDWITNIDLGEECDHGEKNSNSGYECRANCTVPKCGDGIKDLNEAIPVSVYDLVGNLIYQKIIYSTNSSLDIRILPSGVYFLKAGSLRPVRIIKK